MDSHKKSPKKIAILCIAASNQPVYVHYIHTYWTSLINFTNAHRPNIDVFLLFQQGHNIKPYLYLSDNIIVDENKDFNGFFKPEHGHKAVPGILSKTVFALEKLKGKYDIFLRTNLSSMIHIGNLEKLAESKDRFIYSGAGIWQNALRKDLVFRNRVGEDKSIKSLDELASYPGDTFITGSGYILGPDDVERIIANKHLLRYDIVDDVSIGLMIPHHEYIKGFSMKIPTLMQLEDVLDKLKRGRYCHVRLQYFPVEKASALWDQLRSLDHWNFLA